MKLVGHEESRVVVTFSADEMKPERGIYPPALAHAIAQRYGFLHSPLNADKFTPERMEFTFGKLPSDPNISVVRLVILNNFLSVDARTTQLAETIIHDAMEWGFKELGLRRPQSPMRFSYFSSAVVDFDEPIESALSAFQQITRMLAAHYDAYYGQNFEYANTRLTFGSDPLRLPPLMPKTDLTIDRRADHFFDEKPRYFCSGPFKSDDLVSIVGEVEKILLSK